jgi:hypothetical protein
MNQHKPEYLRPALTCGAVAGLLSAIPIIGAANCFCCLWIVGAAALAAKLLARTTGGTLTSGDGALVGALTGIAAAVTDSLVSIPLQRVNLEMARGVLDRISGLGYEMPENMDALLGSGSGLASPALFLLGLFLTAAIFTVVGVIGGVIGVALFARKAPQAPPPAAPPAPPQGSGDAA